MDATRRVAEESRQSEKQTPSKEELDAANEKLIVANFVNFFEPLINNLDKNVDALRFLIFFWI